MKKIKLKSLAKALFSKTVALPFCIGLMWSTTTISGQNFGVGQAAPASKVDVNGNLTVGANFSGTAAPANGAIIEGIAGIGITTPATKLHISSSYDAVTGGLDGNSLLAITNNAGVGGYAGLSVISGTTSGAFIEFGDSDGAERGMVFYDNNTDNMVFTTNGNGQFAMTNDGRMGVGTTTPSGQLTVENPTGPVDLHVTSGNGSNSHLRFYEGPNHKWSFWNRESDDRLHLSDIDLTHGVFIDQDATSWVGYSDKRLKENVQEISVLDKLEAYRVVEYDWKSTGTHDLGVIAQEVHPLFPEIVSVGNEEATVSGINDKGVWGVQYDKLGALALGAAKELKAENEALKAEIKEMKKQVAATSLTANEVAQLRTWLARVEATANENFAKN